MNNTFFVAASSAALGAVFTLLLVPRSEPVARSAPLTVGLLRSSIETWTYSWDNRYVNLSFRRGELYRVSP